MSLTSKFFSNEDDSGNIHKPTRMSDLLADSISKPEVEKAPSFVIAFNQLEQVLFSKHFTEVFFSIKY